MFGFARKTDEVPETNKLNAMRDILLSPNQYTPDKFWLQSRANWLVFLYCDLQLNHPRAIGDCDLVWEGFSKHPYSMWKNDLGKFSHPVIFNTEERLKMVKHNRVRGQVVRMRTDRLIKLDEERQNGVQFLRKRLPITVPTLMLKRDHKLKSSSEGVKNWDYSVPCEDTVWAWSYIGNPAFWLDIPIKVSHIKTVDKSAVTHHDYIMSDVGKTKTMLTVKRYLPNNNAEPYYYFAPNDL